MQILNGAIVKYQGQWNANYNPTPNDVKSAVSAALVKDGLNVVGYSDDTGFFTSHGLGAGSYNVTLSLSVNNGVGFGDERDVVSIINHEVYVASNQFPISGAITQVQEPTGPNGTGAAQNHPIATGSSPNPAQQPSSSPSFLDWLKQLGNNTTFTFAGLGIGLIIAVLLIASPTGMVVSHARRR